MVTVHLVISGKVQGVFYRAAAKAVADSLSVKGTVRNSRDGAVEIFASGEAEPLHSFIQWCHQGPPGAMVTDIRVSETAEISFDDFSIIR